MQIQLKDMSHTTFECDDGVVSQDQIGSPLMDKGKSGGSEDGGLVLKKGPWTSAEDAILVDYVKKHGEGNWNAVQKFSGLSRCGKSCRLRWANHLRPNLKKGAFSAEEERLIVELHAKMGNKWARMAAHLPGRTDNEIKNYWNTRIKRRQRAGLPLYPAELCMQALQDGQQGQTFCRMTNGNKGHHEILQGSGYEIPDIVFDSFKANHSVLPYTPEISDISATGLLMKGLASSQCGGLVQPTMPRHKRLRQSASFYPGYGGIFKDAFPSMHQFEDDSREKLSRAIVHPFPIDHDPDKNPLPFGVVQGSHSFSNGNSSTSEPSYEALKLELPSLQYSEPDMGSWDTSSSPPTLLESVDNFILSPARTGKAESECLSPRNSGLLDALVHESKTMSSAKNNSPEKSTNSSALTPGDISSSTLDICKSEWEEYGDPISPPGHSATSVFNGCTPLSTSGSSLDEQPHPDTFTAYNVKPEPFNLQSPESKHEIPAHCDLMRPDALLASDWFGLGSGSLKDQSTVSDSMVSLLGDDLCNDYKQSIGTCTSDQEWRLNSCAWNNMPSACQMPELP